MALDVIVLAAGKGTRMGGDQPKVMQHLGGKPLLAHVLDAAAALEPDRVHVVVGLGASTVKNYVESHPPQCAQALKWVTQSQQRGTGDAVKAALGDLVGRSNKDAVLILYGDVPLLPQDILAAMVADVTGNVSTEEAQAQRGKLAILTMEAPDPTGLGRILRNAAGEVTGIVEEKDATAEQKALREVNTGIMAAATGRLRFLLGQLDARNAAGEYLLTDVVRHAVAAGCPVSPFRAPYSLGLQGVNTPAELARLERCYREERQVIPG